MQNYVHLFVCAFIQSNKHNEEEENKHKKNSINNATDL